MLVSVLLGPTCLRWHLFSLCVDGESKTDPSREETKTGMVFPAKEEHVNPTTKSFSLGAGRTNLTLIEGCVTSQGIYKTDNKDICELYINKDCSDSLPHDCGRKQPVSLVIGDTIYEAGVHETQKGVVWVSSVVKKGVGREKARLVDALEEIGLRKGDSIILMKNADGVLVLSGSERP